MRRDLADQIDVFFFYLAVISYANSTCKLKKGEHIGVRAGGGARGAAAPPPNFGQLRFFGQQEKIWARPVFKDVSMFI